MVKLLARFFYLILLFFSSHKLDLNVHINTLSVSAHTVLFNKGINLIQGNVLTANVESLLRFTRTKANKTDFVLKPNKIVEYGTRTVLKL